MANIIRSRRPTCDLGQDGRVIANGGEADPSPLTLIVNWH
jgi:hypothetical protein